VIVESLSFVKIGRKKLYQRAIRCPHEHVKLPRSLLARFSLRFSKTAKHIGQLKISEGTIESGTIEHDSNCIRQFLMRNYCAALAAALACSRASSRVIKSGRSCRQAKSSQ
jgi:hypothetical protein